MKLGAVLLMVALGSWGMDPDAEAAGRRGRNWNGMMLSPYGAIPNSSYTGGSRGRGRNAMAIEARREQQAMRMLKAQQRENRASRKGSAAKGGTGQGKGKTAEASTEK